MPNASSKKSQKVKELINEAVKAERAKWKAIDVRAMANGLSSYLPFSDRLVHLGAAVYVCDP